MTRNSREYARRAFGADYEALTEHQRALLDRVNARSMISRDIGEEYEKTRNTFGHRLADKLTTFGGSWTFILLFLGFLVAWVILNAKVLARGEAIDPFPFILLNLLLSMLAALQAPVILMSENRQAAMDRLDAKHDFEVNLKAEMEIQQLHEKLDELREQRWKELVELQQRQIALLESLQRPSK